MAQPSNLVLLLRGAVHEWNATHPPSQRIDPEAELAIAAHEGLSGGIGDGGHAFGPNQGNDAGGVLTGKLPANWTPQQKNAWAWSPAGLRFQLAGVAGVAGGEHGTQAIRDIATRYERPANVGAEISDALSRYGKNAGLLPQGAAPARMSAGAQAPSPRAPAGNLLGSLIASTNTSLGLGSSPTLANLFNVSPAAWGTPGEHKPPANPPASPMNPPLRPLKLTQIDGVQVDPRIAGQLQSVVTRFGVHPTSGYRDAAHNRAVGGAQHSDHLSGDAVDFGGSPQQLAALYAYAQGRYPYVEPMAQAKNHVHISFARPKA